MQVRTERKREKAMQTGRTLTPGLLSERLSRSSGPGGQKVVDGKAAAITVNLDGEQLNHIPSSLHEMLEGVTHLNLANNSFLELPGLDGLTSLQSLSLAHNSISQVHITIANDNGHSV